MLHRCCSVARSALTRHDAKEARRGLGEDRSEDRRRRVEALPVGVLSDHGRDRLGHGAGGGLGHGLGHDAALGEGGGRVVGLPVWKHRSISTKNTKSTMRLMM